MTPALSRCTDDAQARHPAQALSGVLEGRLPYVHDAHAGRPEHLVA